MTNQLIKIRETVKNTKPLIHCITNTISINDCANSILAVGGKPIMAEHPKEVSQITKSAKALAINLGNITDARLESITISGKTAYDNNIPCVIDLVGVACSSFRNDFATRFISKCKPSVIKGNMTELKAMCNRQLSGNGVDVLLSDEVCENNIHSAVKLLKEFSQKTQAVIIATGVTDLIAFEHRCFAVSNGDKMLSQITGTGCMLNALTAAFISAGEILNGALLATVYLGIAGEIAHTESGTGTFRVHLMDALSTLSDDKLLNRIKVREVKNEL